MSVNRWIHACNLKWVRGQRWRPAIYWYQQQFRSIKTSENGPLTTSLTRIFGHASLFIIFVHASFIYYLLVLPSSPTLSHLRTLSRPLSLWGCAASIIWHLFCPFAKWILHISSHALCLWPCHPTFLEVQRFCNHVEGKEHQLLNSCARMAP